MLKPTLYLSRSHILGLLSWLVKVLHQTRHELSPFTQAELEALSSHHISALVDKGIAGSPPPSY